MKPPDLLAMGTLEALQALEAEAMQGSLRIKSLHEERFRSFRDKLRRFFLGHFVLTRQAELPSVQTWDPLTTQRDGTLRQLVTEFRDDVAAAAEDDDQLIEEDLDGAMVEGHNRELWLLAMGGLPAWNYDALPEEDVRLDMLLAAGVAGVSWRTRLDRWQDLTDRRGAQWLRASVVGGRSLDETEQGLDATERQFSTRVTGLYENELWRAHLLGARLARELVQREFALEEVWLARESRPGVLDPLVCPICEALHLTVTALEPVTDSHPGCRCRKVPVPAGYQPTPMSYAEFLTRRG